MISILMLAATATTLSRLPEPINQQRWLTNADYPDYPRRRGEQGNLRFRLTVDQNGKPIACEITKSSGFAALDDLTCSLMMRRARFKPALDLNGAPISSVFSETTNFQISGEAPVAETLADFGFTVRALPGNAKRAMLTLRVIVRENGTLESCEVETSSGIKPIDAIACKTLEGRGPLYIAHLAGGDPIRTMQGLKVAFVAEGTGLAPRR